MIIKTFAVAALICFAGLATHAEEIGSPGFMGMDSGRPNFTKNVSRQEAAMESAGEGYPWRGILIGADHGSQNIHHDNIFVRINQGPVIYQTTIPARQEGSLLPDPGLLWQFYSRDHTLITVYATSVDAGGRESELSDPFALYFSYPVPAECSVQTVPWAVAGPDQVVSTGTRVVLDGALSHDPHGPDSLDLDYTWECFSAPDATVALSEEGRAPVVTFTPVQAGRYYFRLRVKDKNQGEVFNAGPVDYVRVCAVDDTRPYLLANAGRTRQARVGDVVILDAGQSRGSSPIVSYSWTLENPLNPEDIRNMAGLLGTDLCQGTCHLANWNADSCVDGRDLFILAANYALPPLPAQAVVQFVPGIARPHIFKLTVSDGSLTDSETAIVAVNHPNADPVLTPPPVDSSCVE